MKLRHGGSCGLRIGLWLSVLSLAVPLGEALADDTLAARVPADVGLFVEVADADDLLVMLTEPHVWASLAELAGQPADITEAGIWRLRLRQTIGMEPAEAIRVLLSRRVAFVGEGPGRAQDAVVLCEPSRDPRRLLDGWRAVPLPIPGRTSVYLLPNRIGVALQDRLLMFGDNTPSDGMFARLVAFADEGRPEPLAQDPVYRALLARVPRRPDGVFFARLGKGSPLITGTTQPSTRPTASAQHALLPGPLYGSSNMLVSLHRDEELLHFTAAGDGVLPNRETGPGLVRMVQRLPSRTLAVWGSHVYYPTFFALGSELPERNVFRLALELQEKSGVLRRLTDALGDETCVALGAVRTDHGLTRNAPPPPALALLVKTSEPDQALAALSNLVQASASFYNLLSLKVGLPNTLPAVESLDLDGARAQRLDLTGLLGEQPGEHPLDALHVCWAIHEDVLVVASHSDWLRQIIETRRHRGPDLSNALRLTRRPISVRSGTLCVLQSGPIADLGQLWLDYFQKHAPDVLEERWWRQRQAIEQRARLGIRVTELSEEQRLRVASVETMSPSDGVLKIGDVILGCNGRPFESSQPIREIQEGLKSRPNARWFDLTIERDGIRQAVRVAFPFFNGAQMLRRAAAIGKVAQRLVYHDDVRPDGTSAGHLTIELRRDMTPLFSFERSPRETTSKPGRTDRG